MGGRHYFYKVTACSMGFDRGLMYVSFIFKPLDSGVSRWFLVHDIW